MPMHLKCCNFRPTGPFGITLYSLLFVLVLLGAPCAVRRAPFMGLGRSYSALPLAVTNDIRHQPASGVWPAAGPEASLGLGLRQLGLQLLSCSVRGIAAEH
jgi:hypothetical protein